MVNLSFKVGQIVPQMLAILTFRMFLAVIRFQTELGWEICSRACWNPKKGRISSSRRISPSLLKVNGFLEFLC
jgi:hypothetical protein